MRIKRIDLCGFKSFCDNTSLDMQQAITAIVGPNGCGKSNVVDALRWAMGEQSARHLRGKTMEDVIFNGSDSRGPSGMAEISITFDANGRAPAPYASYSEITVTRRLHRDGTSEYLINKLPVRLRDVTNLFLGTGVGTKAYSIIEQGRVGLIISSKPEDRRPLIEEAAGITKYRRRRQLAERRMDATRQNLLRVGDVLDEIGKRLGSLRRQAQKAERYKRYREEMQDIELWAASHRLLELIAGQKLAAADADRIERERSDADLVLQQREVALETARITAAERERELSQLQEELYQLDNRIKLNESRVEFESREADDLERRADQSRGETDELRRQAAQDINRQADVRQQADALQQQRSHHLAQVSAREQVLNDLREQLTAAESAIEQERELAGQAERAEARGEADMRALCQRREDMRERCVRGERERDAAIARRAELAASIGAIGCELENLAADAEQLARRREQTGCSLESLQAQAERGEAELEVLRTELHRRRSRLGSLQEIQARYEGFDHGTRAVMQRHNGSSRERGVLGVVAEMIDAPPAYEVALEAVLGQRLGTVIVEDHRVGMDAIQYLKEGSLGRSSFIARSAGRASLLARAPVGYVWETGTTDAADGGGAALQMAVAGGTRMIATPGVHGPMLSLVGYRNEYTQVAEALLGDVVVVDDLDIAMALWDQVHDETLVTLDGEILKPDGTVTGGSQDAETSGVLKQRREIKELTEIIADLQQQYDVALDRQVSVKAEIAALGKLLQSVTRDAHQGEKEMLTRQKDLDGMQVEVAALATRQQQLEDELAAIQHELATIDAGQVDLDAQISGATDRQQLGRDVLYLLGRERKRLAALARQASSAMTDAKVGLAEAEASCRAIEGNVRHLEQMGRERHERIERLEHGATAGLQRAAELRRSVEDRRSEIADLVTRRANAQDRLSNGRSEYDAQAVVLGELEADIKGARASVSALGADIAKIQLRNTELTMARGHLEDQIWERYREELPKVAGDYHLRAPVDDTQKERLIQLRELIQRMGEINLTAIDEFNELNGRHEFLSKHREDLESALAQLQRAIQRINRTCRKRFLETFEQVDAHFQQVFPRLFHGGRAKLLLTEAEDVLQAGIEIVAQPPGKKLVSIDMMSGGEKALTATSLIFAMFLVKPTPFCLLDEVDAPLDDANVLRFQQLVRELSATSQFIIITHNHTSMEAADRLYGVTMEEPGISKIVSVNLSEAQAVAA